MGALRYVKGFVFEPFLGVFLVPFLILLFYIPMNFSWILEYPLNVLATAAAVLLLSIGVALLVVTTYLLAKVGEGSAAPWDPPKYLVIEGIYRHVRNPMVVGVLFTVLGEAVLFGSVPLFLLFVALFLGNHILFIKQEEPELLERFGEEYKQYLANVPRWLPRLRPWIAQSTEPKNESEE
ncbi:MAG: isoprenylcysteine carboxylmethyltransferase family protein [Candidatus Thorarchaeota archaeon]|nr:MAG: isoprenylcysteine carboxylmethyltransferase family protein [Candidatus Thorarchaeota archaeon]